MVYTILLDHVSVSSNILSLICLYLFGADTLANVSWNVSRPAFLLRRCDNLQDALLSVTSLDNT